MLESIQSKRHQLETAEAIGVPVPRTFHPRSAEEAHAAGEELGFPLHRQAVRERRLPAQRTSVQLFRCENAAELERAYEDAAPYEPMVQELVPGGAEEMYTLGSYLDRRRRRRSGSSPAASSARRAASWAVARVGEAVWVDEVVEQGLALLRALAFHGISQVEMMRDPRDGRYKLHRGQPAALAVARPRRGVRRRPAVDRVPRPGRRPAAAGAHARRAASAGRSPSWPARRTRSQRPPYVDAVFARDDPKPALVQLGRYTLHGVRRFRPAPTASGGVGGGCRRAILATLKQYVPIGVKRRVRKALPERYRGLWNPDWHRGTVRGTDAFWDYLGKLQLDYLVEQGLKPEHYVLDVGCGPLRAGVHFIGYLEPGHYAGIDKRGDTLERARDIELPRYGLPDKRPNLLVNGAFEFSKLGQTFDYAIAQSVFTHLPVNNIVRCLVEMAKVLNPGGRFYATIYENPNGKQFLGEIQQSERVVSYPDRDKYHYDLDTLRCAARGHGSDDVVQRRLGTSRQPEDRRLLARDGWLSGTLRILGIGDAKSRHFARWARRLAERGHEVHVASGRFNPRGELEGLHVHQFQELDPLLRVPVLRRFRMVPALQRLARNVQPDVVHSHYLLPYGYWTARAGLGPLVVSPWGKDAIVDAWQSPEAEQRARVAIAPERALAYVVNSQALEDAAVKLGADRSKFHRIFWHARIDGYSPEHADRGRWRALGWPDDAIVCLSLRNFRPYSNLDVVLRAFAKARAEVPELRLFSTAGGGWTRTEFDRPGDRAGARPVHGRAGRARGRASVGERLRRLRRDARRRRLLPASLLETMASGIPLVVGLAPSMDEWIQQGEGGELVGDRHDVDAVAAAIVRLARDPELRRRYGERNLREVHARFGDPTAQLEEVYAEVLGG